MRTALFILVVLAGASPATAQRVSLPLAGYYRPGTFMPVRVDTANGWDDLRIEATGAMTTRVRRGRGWVIVPVLVQAQAVSDLRAISSGGGAVVHDAAMRALSPGERLIGTAGALPPEEVLGAGAIVRVDLDPLDPLPGPALAWSGMDGVAMDSAAYRRIAPATMDDLLAAGVRIMVRGDDRLDDRPWRVRGGWQVLEPSAVGPRGARLIEEAYLPTYGWSPGWPGAIRRMAALVGMGIGLLAVGATLLPRRWAGWGVIVVAAGGIAAALWLRAVHPPVFQMRADLAIVAENQHLPRYDAWSWQKSRLGGEFAYLVRDPTWPIFASRRHGQSVPMHLQTAGDGTPIAYVFTLPAHATVAFLTRSPDGPPPDVPGAAPDAGRIAPMLHRIYRQTRQTTTEDSHVITVTPWRQRAKEN